LVAALVMRVRRFTQSVLMTAILLGIWFTGSRAGLLAVPVVFTVAIIMGAPRRPVWLAVLPAGLIVLALWMLMPVGGISDRIAPVFDPTDAVVAQHLQTVIDGLAMFQAHPIFGAGLGAYMEEQLRSTGTPLVIHSTPVWLLAETGILGFAVFLGAAARIFFQAVRRRGEPAALLLILILTAMAVMSSVHDMFYARAFWLLLGAALAVPVAAAYGQNPAEGRP
jgi:O-antigen ligase